LDSTLKGMGFEQSPHELAIYRRGNGGNALLVGAYVDDLVITGTKDEEVAAFKEEIKATWESRCTRATPGSRFNRPPTPSTSLS
jgi:ATP-dependent DNA ligase